MRPTLFHLGRIHISSYTALLSLGILVGLGILYLRARRRIARTDLWLDGALVALIFAVVGARLGYVLANWSYYQDHSGKIIKFWLGGLEWRGALLSASLAIIIYSKLRKLNFWSLIDELALLAPIIGIFAWVGCLLTGCSYGAVVDEPHLLAADLPDLFGVWALRYNVQLLAAGWSLVLALWLWSFQRRRPSAGKVYALLLIGCGVGIAFIDGLRGDVSPILWGFRIDVIVDGLVALTGLALLLGLSLGE